MSYPIASRVLLLLAAGLSMLPLPARALHLAQPATSMKAIVATPTMVIEGLGKGAVPLDGLWQFQTGDDLQWSKADYNDSKWETIEVNSPWGTQRHPSYAGFAWYRRHLEILPGPGTSHSYRILIPNASDAYEVYWNGDFIGSYGKVPPRPWWYYGLFPRSFPLTGSAYGTLAIRVWKAPLDAFADESEGGLSSAPLVGEEDTIALNEDSVYWTDVREDLFDYSLIMLRGFVSVLCLLLWSRNRREQIFAWVAVLTATPIALQILQRLFLIPFPYSLARCLNQPLYVLYHVSLWFLLIALLRLNDRKRLMRWSLRLAYVSLSAESWTASSLFSGELLQHGCSGQTAFSSRLSCSSSSTRSY